MSGRIESKDMSLRVNLYDNNVVEIESDKYNGVGIEIRVLDSSAPSSVPKGAIYEILFYRPNDNVKERPFE